MKIEFIKCHGNGNDFILIDETDKLIFQNNKQKEQFAIKICDRKESAGADGLLLLRKSSIADFCMEIFNNDGSEAMMCGNGMRCAARLAFEISKKTQLTIETKNRLYSVFKENDIFPNVYSDSVILQDISFDTKDLPMNTNEKVIINKSIEELSEEFLFSTISMPNPHLIIDLSKSSLYCDDVLKEISQKINANKNIFPNGINISAFKEIETGKIYNRTLERGVGLTYSCGTANCAASIIYAHKNPEYYNSWIEIINKGGVAKCQVIQNESAVEVKLLGNATFTYKGQLELDIDSIGISNIINGVTDIKEIQAFGDMLDANKVEL